MKKLSLKTIAEITGGQILRGRDSLIIEKLLTNWAGIKPGSLLFDFGQNWNPGKPLLDVECEFAVLTDRPGRFAEIPKNAAVIHVKNTTAAFWSFIDYYRGLFEFPVIGVTGTCGKTTTKEMIRHILSKKLKVEATYKSYNAQFRHLGYLMNFDGDTQAAVIEMGVAAPGDLKVACRFFKPQVGVITNIGIDHLNAFGTLENYIRAKSEFMEGLGYKGTLVINADDENINKIDFGNFKGKLLRFGLGDGADFKISDIKQLENGLEYTIGHQGTPYRFYLPGYGEFMVYNAAAAIAAAYAVGFRVSEAGEALKSFHNIERHFEIKKGINGSSVIDDTWSSNPTSAAESLKILKKIAGGRRTIAALGKMSLLGSKSAYYHFATGEKVAETGIDDLVVIGEDAREIGKGALGKGMRPEQIHYCADSQQAYEVMRNLMDENTVVLLKTTMLASYGDLAQKLTAGVK